MAYTNVSAVDAGELISQIASFAANQGWTIVHQTTTTVVLGWGSRPSYIVLRTGTRKVMINCCRTWNSGLSWDAQVDQFRTSRSATKCEVYSPSTPMQSVYLFGGTTPEPYVHAVWELEPGYYRHIVFGFIETYVPGEYCTYFDTGNTNLLDVTNNDYVSFVEYKSFPLMATSTGVITANWRGGFDYVNRAGNRTWYSCFKAYGTNSSDSPYRGGGFNSHDLFLHRATNPTASSSRTTLMPLEIFVQDPDDLSLIPVGIAPGIRIFDVELATDGEEFTYGPDEWKVFPLIRKGEDLRSGQYDQVEHDVSEYIGVAYLK